MLANLPQLPMGTIMTVCMLIGLVFSAPYVLVPSLKPLPKALAITVGLIVMLAGIWNTFWHGLQNLENFWGQAAAVSGVFMMMTSLYIMRYEFPVRLLVFLGLLACFLVYAITIHRL